MKEAIEELYAKSNDWHALCHPAVFGKEREAVQNYWDEWYGEGNWKIGWRLRDGQVWDFSEVFWREYVVAYALYFKKYPHFLQAVCSHSYTYGKDLIDFSQAYDPYARSDLPGVKNQFHHVAINYAVGLVGEGFRGSEPLQVWEGKAGATINEWPKGWWLSPGRIPAVRPELMPDVYLPERCWETGSIEDFYQRTETLFIGKRLVFGELSQCFHQLGIKGEIMDGRQPGSGLIFDTEKVG